MDLTCTMACVLQCSNATKFVYIYSVVLIASIFISRSTLIRYNLEICFVALFFFSYFDLSRMLCTH